MMACAPSLDARSNASAALVTTIRDHHDGALLRSARDRSIKARRSAGGLSAASSSAGDKALEGSAQVVEVPV
jgi:hypothetical protein